jgi:hypothetical protein
MRGDSLDDQASAARDADFLARLLLACEHDAAVLPDVIQVWYESRRRPSTPAGMKIKRAIFVGSSLRLMNSYGNLFGIFGETAPAFDHARAQRVGGAGGGTSRLANGVHREPAPDGRPAV